MFINFLSLLCLISMTACGQQKAARKLNVSTAFAVTSSDLAGGMNVTGKSADGKWFSINATTGTSVTIPLENGDWTFYATGWSNNLTGATLCSITNIVLTNDVTDIDLNMSLDKCTDPLFAMPGGPASYSIDADGFKPLSIFNCGTFFKEDGSSAINASTILLGTFCDSAPLGMRKRAASIQVIIPGNLTQGVSSPSISECKTLTSPYSAYPNTGFRIPPNQIPVHIRLYENENCQDDYVQYRFNRGLVSGDPSHGGMVKNTSSDQVTNTLLLAFTNSLQGRSPLFSGTENLLPKITCSGTWCGNFPTINPGNALIQQNGGMNRIKVGEDGYSCATSADLKKIVPGAVSGLTLQGTGCQEDNGNVYLVVNENSVNTCASAACTVTFNKDGTDITYNVKSNSSSFHNAYETIYRTVGGDPVAAGPSGLPFLISMNAFSWDKAHTGSTRYLRENLGPDSAFSLMPGICANMSLERTFTLSQEGQTTSIKIFARGPNLASAVDAVPLQICHDTEPGHNDFATCSTKHFDKIVVVKERKGGEEAYKTSQILKVSCSKKLGYMHSYYTGDDGEYREEQEKVYWNTQNEVASRIEYYREEKEYTSPTLAANTLKLRRQSYEYVQKIQASNNFISSTMDYEMRIESGERREYVNKAEVNFSGGNEVQYSGGRVSYQRPSSYNPDLDVFKIFDQTILKSSHLFQVVTGVATPSYFSIPERNVDYAEAMIGGLFIKAFVYRKNDGNIWMRYYDGSSWAQFAITPTGSYYGPQVAIDPTNGKMMVAFYQESTNALETAFVDTSLTVNMLGIVQGSAAPVGNLALVGNSGAFHIFWTELNAPGFKMYSNRYDVGTGTWEANDAEEVNNFPTASGSPINYSLKATLHSTNKIVLAWYKIFSVNNIFEWKTYDPSGVLGNRATNSKTFANIGATQPDMNFLVNNFSLVTSGSDTYVNTTTANNGKSWIAKFNPVLNNFSDLSPIGVRSSAEVYISKCFDALDGDPFTCSISAPPQLPPILSNTIKDKSLHYMQPSIFGGIFLSPSAFGNLQ